MNANNPCLAMIKALGVVSAICGLIIVLAYQFTFEAVKNNKRVAVERSVFKMFPQARSMEAFHIRQNQIEKTQDYESSDFLAVYDAKDVFLGVAAQGKAKGYGDFVRLMFAYEPQCQCIRSIAVVSMRETPGIGDKIAKDKNFLKNFQALDVRLNAEMKALEHRVETVKNGTKNKEWQIDSISGATITSRAVGRAINESASLLLPVLVPELKKLERK